MKAPVQLKPLHKRTLYLTTLLLWLSGALWLYFKYFRQLQGEYGPQTHPAQPILLEIHGAAAMAFLVLFGTLLMQHVPSGWTQKRQRPSGIALISLSVLLTFTGWGLYYAVGDELRKGIVLIHWVIGLAFPAFLLLHIYGEVRRKRAVRR